MVQISYTYHDKDGYRRTLYREDDNRDTFGVHTEMNVDSLVENNKAMAEIHPDRSTNKLVARVPMTIYEQSVHENWDEEQWRRWLNDPDNRAFRVWKGNL
jgi:hypothetical protein